MAIQLEIQPKILSSESFILSLAYMHNRFPIPFGKHAYASLLRAVLETGIKHSGHTISAL